MLISSLFFTLKKNKKVEFFFCDYQPSEELLAILEEKSGKKTYGLTFLCHLNSSLLFSNSIKHVKNLGDPFFQL
jgi:hypothetical protein